MCPLLWVRINEPILFIWVLKSGLYLIPPFSPFNATQGSLSSTLRDEPSGSDSMRACRMGKEGLACHVVRERRGLPVGLSAEALAKEEALQSEDPSDGPKTGGGYKIVPSNQIRSNQKEPT